MWSRWKLPETEITVTMETITWARMEIAHCQAQLDFMQAAASSPGLSIIPESADVFQMSMFSEPILAIKKTRR